MANADSTAAITTQEDTGTPPGFEYLNSLIANAREAWIAAEEEDGKAAAKKIFAEDVDWQCLSHAMPAVAFTSIAPSWEGGSCTNTQVEELLHKLKYWATQYLPGHNVTEALDTLEMLRVRALTEIDETLVALGMFRYVIEKRAPDLLTARPGDSHYIHDGKKMIGLDIATMYLHRWMDRGGAVGNVAQPGRPGHPMEELRQTKALLRRLHLEIKCGAELMDSAFDELYAVLCVLAEKLPDDSTVQQLSNAAVSLAYHSGKTHDQWIERLQLPPDEDAKELWRPDCGISN